MFVLFNLCYFQLVLVTLVFMENFSFGPIPEGLFEEAIPSNTLAIGNVNMDFEKDAYVENVEELFSTEMIAKYRTGHWSSGDSSA